MSVQDLTHTHITLVKDCTGEQGGQILKLHCAKMMRLTLLAAAQLVKKKQGERDKQEWGDSK